MELRLRDVNGGDVGTVDVDEVPDAESVLCTADGTHYVRNQRNEGQWRAVTVVKLKAVPKVEEPAPQEEAPKPQVAPPAAGSVESSPTRRV